MRLILEELQPQMKIQLHFRCLLPALKSRRTFSRLVTTEVSAPTILRRRSMRWNIPFAVPITLQTSLIIAAKGTVITKYRARISDCLKSQISCQAKCVRC